MGGKQTSSPLAEPLTVEERAEKRRIDRKAFAGKATRREILRGLELKARRDHAKLEGRSNG